MFERAPNGYFVRDLVVFNHLRRGGYVAKGFVFEAPDLTNSPIGDLNEFQDQLCLLLASLHENQRLQVQYFCDSDYRTDLLRYQAETERCSNVWTRRARNERFSRYWKAMAEAPAREPLDRAQYADLMIWLPGDILTKTDRMSMAVGLEAREPLLDYRLIEFAASLPASMRVKRGTGKAIMKHAMERYLPHDILYRPKMGFVTPVSQWFRGALVEQARGFATSSTLARSGWFDMAEIERIVAAHQSGRRAHGRLIWQFFMLEKSLAKLFWM